MNNIAKVERLARIPAPVVDRINELGFRTYKDFAQAKGLEVDSFYALDCNKFVLVDGRILRSEESLRKIAQALGWKVNQLSNLMIACYYRIHGCGPVDLNDPPHSKKLR